MWRRCRRSIAEFKAAARELMDLGTARAELERILTALEQEVTK